MGRPVGLGSLRLSERQAAWFWHVTVSNLGTDPVEVDLVHTQDVALAPLGAVRTNEYYVSQYLDLTPVEVPGHGVAIGVRQKTPVRRPGCWSARSDARTAGHRRHPAHGRGRPEGTPWPGLSTDPPAARLQGEHTVAALQTEPTVLRPGETWTSGF